MKNLFNEIAGSLNPHPDQAQLVLDLGSKADLLNQVSEIIDENSVFRSGTQREQHLPEMVLVIRTAAEICEDAVLHLTGTGFSKLQLVHPAQQDHEEPGSDYTAPGRPAPKGSPTIER